MGLGFVIILWAALGSILAVVAAVILGNTAAFFTRGVQQGRGRLVLGACLLPFLCLGWAACVFVFQAVVNEGLLDRDLGLGDTWHCPLPNGYQVLMIDIPDEGWVFNPKTQPHRDGVSERGDAIAGIRTMQVAGRYILGSRVDGYFLLDTEAGTHTTFDSFDGLRGRAVGLNVTPDLQPIRKVYSKYRFTWFDVLAGVMFCMPPIAGVVFLVLWARRLRRTQREVFRTLATPVHQ
jgi:hypothetical protein